jgi:hypothetical protein
VATPSGSGFRAAGRGEVRLGDRKQTRVGVEVSALRAPTTASATDGYVQVRGFASTKIVDRVLVTIDLAEYALLRTVNGQRSSFIATLTASYDVTPAWRLTLAGAAGENPYFASYAQAFLRATYRFDVGGT